MITIYLDLSTKRHFIGSTCNTQREERLVAFAEVDPSVLSAVSESRLIRLHAAGPRAPSDAVLPPSPCPPLAELVTNELSSQQKHL